MQIETLNHIKQQIVSLDPDSKKHLADFLAEELHEEIGSSFSYASDEERQQQIDWLKSNREQYAQKYVALYGSKFVAEAPSLAVARSKANELGYPNAFITFVFSESDEVFGGW